jgi:hypothetical protein
MSLCSRICSIPHIAWGNEQESKRVLWRRFVYANGPQVHVSNHTIFVLENITRIKHQCSLLKLLFNPSPTEKAAQPLDGSLDILVSRV